MNPQLHHIIVSEIKKALGKKEESQLSRYEMAKGTLVLRRSLWSTLRSIVLMGAGVFSAGFGLEGFLIPNGLIDGGVTGISLLTKRETGLSLSLLLVLINLPFIFLGWKQISQIFAIKSIVAIAVLAIVVATVHFPIVTSDKLLVAVFGGFFLGAGIGLVIRGGGVIDGTEILAITLSKKRSITVGDVILVLNIIIFSVGAYLISVEVALYSILTYLAASKTVDFILEGIEEFTSVTIISPHSDEIAQMIKEKMRRGLTIYTGKKGYGKRGENTDSIDIIFTIVTRLEIARLNSEIEKIDPNAFIVMQSIKDTRGGMVRKRPLK
ncbi:MAG TPA: YitT family protein [Chitinophagaceae bacterium]|nr:YitT family protein [Chitinophagaceae bacterium]